MGCLWWCWCLLLQGEHGTGRNIAPFVEVEWGRQATAIMQRIKDVFDPQNLLNPGVILNPVRAVSTGLAERFQTLAFTALVLCMLLEHSLCQMVLPDTPSRFVKGRLLVCVHAAAWLLPVQDPNAHMMFLKPSPPAASLIDNCMECGYCEAVCPSR